MPVSRLLFAFLVFGALAAPVAAADSPPRGTCLNKAEQRAAIDSGKAIPLGQALKSLRSRGKRAEVVRARLCRRGDGLVYVLTLLARSGKVTLVTVDAANGEIVNGR